MKGGWVNFVYGEKNSKHNFRTYFQFCLEDYCVFRTARKRKKIYYGQSAIQVWYFNRLAGE